MPFNLFSRRATLGASIGPSLGLSGFPWILLLSWCLPRLGLRKSYSLVGLKLSLSWSLVSAIFLPWLCKALLEFYVGGIIITHIPQIKKCSLESLIEWDSVITHFLCKYMPDMVRCCRYNCKHDRHGPCPRGDLVWWRKNKLLGNRGIREVRSLASDKLLVVKWPCPPNFQSWVCLLRE